MPYLMLRNRRAGNAVSIVKAGARIAGMPCGAVRLPPLDLVPEEESQLAALMAACGMPVDARRAEPPGP